MSKGHGQISKSAKLSRLHGPYQNIKSVKFESKSLVFGLKRKECAFDLVQIKDKSHGHKIMTWLDFFNGIYKCMKLMLRRYGF